MRKITLLLTIAFISIFNLGINAQSYTEIGNGTVSTSYPTNSVWNYGWYSYIIPQSDVGDAKTITKIAFHCNNGPKTMANQKIYLKTTSNTEFSDGIYEDPTANGYTLVYTGTVEYNDWTIIELDTQFEYNGTDNLIIHYENHSGTTTYTNFYSTSSYVNNNKSQGNDQAFPTTTGYLNPYPSSVPNVRLYYASSEPATPANPIPASLSEKIDLNTQLSFSIGTNTTAYDIYFSSDSSIVANLEVSAKIVSDAAVASAQTFTYTFDSILSPKTTYFWRVIAKDATNSTNGDVWQFTTQNIISQLPYSQGFEGDDIFYPGWYGYYTDWTYPITGSNAIWGKSVAENAHTGTSALSCTPYAGSKLNSSIMSPRIFLPENCRLSFVWRNGASNKTADNDTTFFEITTDGGQAWTTLDTLSPTTSQAEYTQVQQDISAYAGNNVYIRWRYVRHNTSNTYPVYIDDLIIEETPQNAVIELSTNSIEFTNITQNAHNAKHVNIVNNGSIDLNISDINVNTPFTALVDTNIIEPGQSVNLTVTLEGAQTGNFSQTLTIVSNATGENTIALSGTVSELSPSFFNTFESVTEYELPQNWNKIRTNDPAEIYNDVYVKKSPYDAHSSPNTIKMINANDSISPLLLLTEGTKNFDTNTLKFYASKTINNPQTVNLIIGVMDDPEDASTFDTIKVLTLEDTMTAYSISFPTENTKPYIAFKHGQNKKWQSIWIDDVEWAEESTNPPTCADLVFPENASNNNEQDITIKWTNSSSNVTGYYLSVGTDYPPTNIIDNQDLGDTTEYKLNNLEFGTTYYWQITAYNQYGSATGCEVWSFNTMDDPMLTIPWSQGFEDITPASGFQYPLGWTIINGNETSSSWDVIANNATYPNNAHSGDQAMNIAFGFTQPLNDWLVTPSMQLKAGNKYKLSFWLKAPVYTSGGTDSHESLDVFIGTDNTEEKLTTQIWNNDFIQLPDYELQQASFTAPASGKYYIGFHAKSEALQWITMIDDVTMECTDSVGINEINNNIKFYPNPVKNSLTIVLPNSNYNELTITNSIGAKVKRMNITESKKTINMQDLTPGIYFINLTDVKGNSTTQKFVKQ